MVTFPFNKTASKPDPYLKTKLLAEIEGIFQWFWKMDDNQMMQTLKNRGSIASVTEASIENQLENQPVLQFIFELADSDSTLDFGATEVYLKFKAWCDETGKGQLNQTRFGKELKKMDGLLKKFSKKGCYRYLISPKTKFDFAEHFGITNSGQLNPLSSIAANPNPLSSNPSSNGGKEKSIDTLDSSTSKNQNKNKNKNIYKEKVSPKTLQTIQPSIIDEELAVGSAWDTNSDDDDPYWG